MALAEIVDRDAAFRSGAALERSPRRPAERRRCSPRVTSISSASGGRPCGSSAARIIATKPGSRDAGARRIRRDEESRVRTARARSRAGGTTPRAPSGDFVADAGLVGDRHVLLRATRAELRVVPAHLALDAGQVIRVDGYARLEGELHLADARPHRAAPIRSAAGGASAPAAPAKRLRRIADPWPARRRHGRLQQLLGVDVAALGERHARAERRHVVRRPAPTVRRDATRAPACAMPAR